MTCSTFSRTLQGSGRRTKLHLALSVVTSGIRSLKTASTWVNQSSGHVGQNEGNVAMLTAALSAALAAALVDAAEDPDMEADQAPDVEVVPDACGTGSDMVG